MTIKEDGLSIHITFFSSLLRTPRNQPLCRILMANFYVEISPWFVGRYMIEFAIFLGMF